MQAASNGELPDVTDSAQMNMKVDWLSARHSLYIGSHTEGKYVENGASMWNNPSPPPPPPP